ncbi:hemolysin III family protein [Dasania sp. GY-MA-18]|uniref:Hemolysin III family protein n=1 Tax=Dasania phycosphaerae TaxID=2950436 RepID=A0A9J6RNG6_9GAMM|nr:MULTISPECIES: hemolysin III family protein [Dasania]MCR8923457.1 hemolysin III family protein [Dasania sp. GY-MA-18]MCZ0865890.1 hemolysin III family protein [Dasania phycosphaerae]MCZ0869614.1 hemolysin III family protein [Dasania phycosphaerae]
MYHGEKLNSITHLIGAVLALIGFGALLTISIQLQSWRHILSFTVFGVTLVLLYTMSTLYHSFHPPKLKKIFQKLDHIAIYLLIAGTYTPYMLVSLQDDGLVMLAVVWGLALVGLLLDALVPKRIVWLQIIIYLVMGWVCTLQYQALQDSMAAAGVRWLTAGGVAYTVGIVFYLLGNLSQLRHAHGIWHLFVLTGSLCHFISIMGYVR